MSVSDRSRWMVQLPGCLPMRPFDLPSRSPKPRRTIAHVTQFALSSLHCFKHECWLLPSVGNPSARTDRVRGCYVTRAVNSAWHLPLGTVEHVHHPHPGSVFRLQIPQDTDLLLLERNERTFCFIYFHGSVKFYEFCNCSFLPFLY